jgi:hypothetical protein
MAIVIQPNPLPISGSVSITGTPTVTIGSQPIQVTQDTPTGVTMTRAAGTSSISVSVPAGNRALRLIASKGPAVNSAGDKEDLTERVLEFAGNTIAYVVPGGPIVIELADANLTSGTFTLNSGGGTGALLLISVDI